MVMSQFEIGGSLITRVRKWVKVVKRDALALWLAARDPRTPWYAKALAAFVAAYAFSPVDLIPDFIPVVGYLDDLLLVPLGITVIIALIPRDLMDEFRAEAVKRSERPVSRAGFIIVATLWIVAAAGSSWLAWSYLH